MKLRSKLPAAFGVAIALVGILVVVHRWSMARSDHMRKRITRSHATLTRALNVQLETERYVTAAATGLPHRASDEELIAPRDAMLRALDQFERTQLQELEGLDERELGAGDADATERGDHDDVSEERSRLAAIRAAVIAIDRRTSASDPSSAARRRDDIQATVSELRSLVAGAVVDEEDEVLSVERSAAALETTLARLSWLIGAVSLVAMLFVLARLVAPLVRRIAALSRATRGVADGNYGVVLDARGNDELAELCRAFTHMAAELQRSRDAMRRAGEDMRRVLDTVEQGLVALDADGRMSPQCSRQLSVWLGDYDAGTRFADYLRTKEPACAAHFETSFDQLVKARLPRRLLIHQLPRSLEVDGRRLAIAYRCIPETGAMTGLLVSVRDVTAEHALERLERDRRESVELISHVILDRPGVEQFLQESERMVRRLVDEPALPRDEVRRVVHTLKGNASLFGCTSLVELCDRTEARLDDTGEPLSVGELDEIQATLVALTARLGPFLDATGDRFEIERHEYDHLLDQLRAGAGPAQLLEIVEAWQGEPVADQLKRVANGARSLAARLGKPGTRIEVHAEHLRLDPQRWSAFWSAFVHAVRNAVDHGIEPPALRSERGKQESGVVTLTAERQRGELVVAVTDDGAGVDWDAVTRTARELGVGGAATSPAHQLLFVDGLSTRGVATSTSGRGVGLGALRSEVEALGGVISVRSERHRGTRLECRFPSMR